MSNNCANFMPSDDPLVVSDGVVNKILINYEHQVASRGVDWKTATPIAPDIPEDDALVYDDDLGEDAAEDGDDCEPDHGAGIVEGNGKPQHEKLTVDEQISFQHAFMNWRNGFDDGGLEAVFAVAEEEGLGGVGTGGGKRKSGTGKHSRTAPVEIQHRDSAHDHHMGLPGDDAVNGVELDDGAIVGSASTNPTSAVEQAAARAAVAAAAAVISAFQQCATGKPTSSSHQGSGHDATFRLGDDLEIASALAAQQVKGYADLAGAYWAGYQAGLLASYQSTHK